MPGQNYFHGGSLAGIKNYLLKHIYTQCAATFIAIFSPADERLQNLDEQAVSAFTIEKRIVLSTLRRHFPTNVKYAPSSSG